MDEYDGLRCTGVYLLLLMFKTVVLLNIFVETVIKLIKINNAIKDNFSSNI